MARRAQKNRSSSCLMSVTKVATEMNFVGFQKCTRFSLRVHDGSFDPSFIKGVINRI